MKLEEFNKKYGNKILKKWKNEKKKMKRSRFMNNEAPFSY
jgi:hypothetical protein